MTADEYSPQVEVLVFLKDLREATRHQGINYRGVLTAQRQLDRFFRPNRTQFQNSVVGCFDGLHHSSVAEDSADQIRVLRSPILCLNVIFLTAHCNI